MPAHGLKADLELVVLVLSAAVASYLITDQILSNILLTGLISALFFLSGLHLDLGNLNKTHIRKKSFVTGLASVYLIAPIIALLIGILVPVFRDIIVVIAVSAGALASPKIWSNLTNSDGALAERIGNASLLISILAVPTLLLLTGVNIDFGLMIQNSLFPLLGFLTGLILRNLETPVLTDLRIHFSKLSFWLIIVILGVQTHMLYIAEGGTVFETFVGAAIVFTAFCLTSFGAGYLFSKASGLYEKEARTIGFSTGSKNIAVAFFVALHIDGMAVALVGIYYFVRQLTGLLAVELMVHGELRSLKRLVLKD